MAANRYLVDNAEAIKYQPQPLNEADTAILTQAVIDAEDKIDGILSKEYGIITPITGADITTLLKRACAKLVAAILYSGADQNIQAGNEEKAAMGIIKEYVSKTDLDHGEPISAPDIINYQEEFISDWNDPNATAEAMDE